MRSCRKEEDEIRRDQVGQHSARSSMIRYVRCSALHSGRQLHCGFPSPRTEWQESQGSQESRESQAGVRSSRFWPAEQRFLAV